MTTTQSTYYIQTSTDGGKTFDMQRVTKNRDRAFELYLYLSEDLRTRMFKDNQLLLATHIEDCHN